MWYYAEDNEQRGPISEAEFQALIQAGTIKDDTLVWREGMTNWQPWREAKLAASAGAPPIPDGAPAPFASQASQSKVGGVTEAQVRQRDYEHDISGYIGQAWELVKKDLGGIVGATALVGLCVLAANIIPYLSIITGILFTGPLTGGLMYYFVKKVRGESAVLGDAFCGFGPLFGQLIAGKVIPSLLAILALIPAGFLAGIAIFTGALVGKHNGTENLLSGTLVVSIGFAVVGLCVMIYLSTCWVFTLWLVADKKLTFWPAMQLSRDVVRKHWWQTFLLGLVAGLVAMAGALLCLVGLLVSAPVSIAIYAYAYEKLFGDLQPGS